MNYHERKLEHEVSSRIMQLAVRSSSGTASASILQRKKFGVHRKTLRSRKRVAYLQIDVFRLVPPLSTAYQE
ncbi:hypothetical protein CPC08DRAFT_105553 [Agrocybe pediades]|nr:hypothetical protein CPC08DRAFT_105553 [Agrocybe pediades]